MNCKEYETKSGKPIRLWQGDCMELMEGKPENHWNLAIVDPPYGIDAGNYSDKPCVVEQSNGKYLNVDTPSYKKSNFDLEPASIDYLGMVDKKSNKEIVWGGNYFGLRGGFLVWDKLNGESDQYDAEMAWLSWTMRLDRVYYKWSGMIQGKKVSTNPFIANEQQGNKSLNEKRIHPTQKPVKLYRWLLQNYAEERDIILDTHGGSMSLAIACYIEDFELDIIELDEDYYNDAVQRFEQHISQQVLF